MLGSGILALLTHSKSCSASLIAAGSISVSMTPARSVSGRFEQAAFNGAGRGHEVGDLGNGLPRLGLPSMLGVEFWGHDNLGIQVERMLHGDPRCVWRIRIDINREHNIEVMLGHDLG